MRILFASGKGGAGKTTVTAGMARVWPRSFVLADADVEAPDLRLFLPHSFAEKTPVEIEVPRAVNVKCDGCGKCLDICQFHAIARLGGRIVFFPDMCHGCGGCFAVCEPHAIVAGTRLLGEVHLGTALNTVPFLEGRTRIGEPMTPPVIRALLKAAEKTAYDRHADLIVDAPPGVSCPVMTAVQHADAVVLVADPTPFGLSDFLLAHIAVRASGLPVAVVINRSGQEEAAQSEAALRAYCEKTGLFLAGALPFDREMAKANAENRNDAPLSDEWTERFKAVSEALLTFFTEACRHA